MNKTLTWLHLSDLHLCSAKSGWKANDIIKKLKDDLKEMLHNYDLKPDFLFLTGDLAFGELRKPKSDTDKKLLKVQPENEDEDDYEFSLQAQFEEVHVLMNSICELFELSDEQIFIVPGNHDVNRNSIIEEKQTSYFNAIAEKSHTEQSHKINTMLNTADKHWQHFILRLDEYKNFLKEKYPHLLKDEKRLTYFEKRNVNGIKVGIAGFNSAWSCGNSKNSEKGGLWLGGEWQINTLSQNLSECDIKIALAHHPLSWFVEQESPNIDPSLEQKFHFFLHGHDHHEWVDEKHRSQFIRIAAGACSAENSLETGYSFVRLDFTQGSGEVWLRKLDDLGLGWIPRVLKGKTNNDGLWKLNDLHWLKKPNVDDEIEPIITALETNVISDDISQHLDNQIETKVLETDVSPTLSISSMPQKINKYTNSPALATFNLFGAFNEKNQADVEIIEQLII